MTNSVKDNQIIKDLAAEALSTKQVAVTSKKLKLRFEKIRDAMKKSEVF